MEYATPPVEGMTIYSAAYLRKLPTLSIGQADDLKLETGGLRYWLCRCGPEDGESWEVHVERMESGMWQYLTSYRKDS